MLAITFGCSLMANLIADAVYGKGYYNENRWPLAVALVTAGAIIDLVALYFKKRRPDQASRLDHTFFFIPMLWWGTFLLLIAGYLAVSEIIKSQ